MIDGDGMERLDKLIASQNCDGRKAAQNLIKRGEVSVNGEVCRQINAKVDPAGDEITINGSRLNFSRHVYIMMNKPAGVVSATSDKNCKTVVDIVPDNMKRKGIFPVGRLDKDTEGLLLLTDDGEFAHSITSPKKHIDKCYEAVTDNEVTPEICSEFARGIVFSDGTKCRSATLKIDKMNKNKSLVTISEGKYHQVKKMFLCCGLKVVQLKRISIGDLYLDGNLPIGGCKFLTDLDKRQIFVGKLH